MPAQASIAAMSRLALGTAQFGLNYGVANRGGQVDGAAVAAILARAAQAHIDTLDTAIAYGTSEKALGMAGVVSWRVISKLPPLPPDVMDVVSWVRAQVQGSLERLGIAQLDGVLLHRSADLLGSRSHDYVRALEGLKSRGHVRAVGVSIYDPGELDALWPRWRPDLVQAPCNVLDRRIVRSGWLAKLTDCGVRVHVRSVLLQGLLAMPSAERPAWFARWAALLDRWLAWCGEMGASPIQAALAFVRGLSGVERYVVGVDSRSQLEQLLTAEATAMPPVPDDMYSDDLELIDPSRWKLA